MTLSRRDDDNKHIDKVLFYSRVSELLEVSTTYYTLILVCFMLEKYRIYKYVILNRRNDDHK